MPEIDMDKILYLTDFEVSYIDHAGSDQRICEAARVSTLGLDALDTKESSGLINFLMRGRHGSPFEHGLMSFRITAPIFMWREFMRHRIGFSYNEQSGRYMELEPSFYVPPAHRPLIQTGKAGEYNFTTGTTEQHDICVDAIMGSCDLAWHNYQHMLNHGIAKEVARMVLPVTTYSTAYVTCNPRSMMSFLALRTKHAESAFPSYPQWEINQVADAMEIVFKKLYPLTHAAFVASGRVAP